MPDVLQPYWIAPSHPLHLSRKIREQLRREFHPHSVFLNLPYTQAYTKLETAILATVTAYGLRPRLARERSRMEIRLLKIFELILACPFGITDLSHEKRMNMPLELGMMLALGRESLVMARGRYAALKFVSDLNFCDILYHEGGVRKLIVGLSRWIEQTSSSKRLSTEFLLERYRKFGQVRKDLGDDFDRLRPDEIVALLPVAEHEFKFVWPRA